MQEDLARIIEVLHRNPGQCALMVSIVWLKDGTPRMTGVDCALPIQDLELPPDRFHQRYCLPVTNVMLQTILRSFLAAEKSSQGPLSTEA